MTPRQLETGVNVSKYNAQKVSIDGHKFDSKREAARYGELRLLEKAGEIRNLELHPRWPLAQSGIEVKIRSKGFPNGKQCKYTADFKYLDLRTNELVVEDVKGMVTEAAKLRIAVFEALYKIKVEIIK